MAMPFFKNKKLTASGWIALLIIGALIIYLLTPPPWGPIPESARKNAVANNLSQIVKAYAAYMHTGANPRMLEAKPGYTAHMAAYDLAEDEHLNDAHLWFFATEDNSSGLGINTILLDLVPGDISPKINPEFMNQVLGFEVAANVSPDAPATTTPIVWTHGLREDGTWAPDAPWKGTGSYVAYLDGHVEWLDKSSITAGGGPFVKYGTNIPTVNIREALPPGAVILSAEPNGRAGPPDPPSQN